MLFIGMNKGVVDLARSHPTVGLSGDFDSFGGGWLFVCSPTVAVLLLLVACWFGWLLGKDLVGGVIVGWRVHHP